MLQIIADDKVLTKFAKKIKVVYNKTFEEPPINLYTLPTVKSFDTTTPT